MTSFLWPAFVLALFVAAAVAALWGYRFYTTGDTSFSFAWLFPARPEPRLSVTELASVDNKRKLVLIRRDDVEHLIMTGGPVDVVIETGIAAPVSPLVIDETDLAERSERVEPSAPVFGRSRRGFGQAVNE
jgi:flagellar protein FliO/FliZ